jgi:hypothetical protein
MGMVVMLVDMDALMVAAATETKGKIQPVLAKRLPLGNQLVKGVIVVDGTVAHHHRPITEIIEKEQIVVDNNQRSAIFPQQFLENLFLAWIKIRGRFVENEHLGVHCHNRREGGSFFLAVTEQVGRFVAQFFQADRRQLFENPGDHRILIESLIHRADGHVIKKRSTEPMIIGVL